MKLAVFLLVIAFTEVTKCARILVIFPAPSRSHYILGNALAKGLAEAGHEVTMVSPFTDKNPPKNGKYNEIILTGHIEFHQKQMDEMDLSLVDIEKMNPLLAPLFMNGFGNELTRITLEHPSFKALINSDQSFDAVIEDQFLNDALKVVGYHYKIPLILFSTSAANPWVNPAVGNPSPPSYIADIFLGYENPMTFWQRLANLLYTFLQYLNYNLLFLPIQNRMMKEYFPDAPDLSDLYYNASLILLNSHESINQPVPHVPSMIDVGGLHIKPSKVLPQDLKEFMDSAKDGVIYFSMGSNIKPSLMPNDTRNVILKALGKIKQKVLWKWDEETIPGKPDNIKLGKWFPQQEILAHPNTKLFITHGGLLSIIETVHHGVPILAFPIFADQKTNAGMAETIGIGIKASLSEITEEELSNILGKLLNDPKYRDAVKRRSNLMHDRPMKPLDLAVYWVEFIVRHKGASHLRVAALDLPWYQYLLLDVVAFIGLISISLIAVTYIVIKKIFCTGKVSKIKVKKN